MFNIICRNCESLLFRCELCGDGKIKLIDGAQNGSFEIIGSGPIFSLYGINMPEDEKAKNCLVSNNDCYDSSMKSCGCYVKGICSYCEEHGLRRSEYLFVVPGITWNESLLT